MKQRLHRADAPAERTWQLEDLFQTNEAWEQELDAVHADCAQVVSYQGRVGQSAATLLACLDAHEALDERIGRVATYARLRLAEDGTNPVNQANYARLASVVAEISSQLAFIESEILELPEGTFETYLTSEPNLSVYKAYVMDLQTYRNHRLSKETERVLSALGEVFSAPYMIYERSKSSDMVFSSIRDPKTNTELPNSFALYEDEYEQTVDTDIRRNAYDSFVSTLLQYKNTFAATYATEVKRQVVEAKFRGYSSVTEMLLKPQHVTEEMYYNQLDVIQTELAPHMRKLANLRKRLLGLESMRHCDLKVPLDSAYNPTTSYEEASKIILEALAVMGPEYLDIMKTALSERWVDLADNVGKSTGAFCSSPYGAHPFILITWTDTMRQTFVLAHELGHAGHFALANKHQRKINTRPSTYFIEAPSTMNEMLLGSHILANTNDPRMRRWVITQLLGTYYHNFVTHLLEGEYQRRIYALAEAGKPLTASVLCEQTGDILSNFWGDSVDIDEGATLLWMRQPHYYMGLYPYTYSAGLTASTIASKQIREQGQPAVDRWLDALKAGGTMKPVELLSLAGVEMSRETISQAVAYVGSLVDELEQSFSAPLHP